MEKGKLIELVVRLEIEVIFLLFGMWGIFYRNNPVIIFLSGIIIILTLFSIILTFFPRILKFNDGKENDIFYFKCYTPISLGFAISTFFLIVTNPSGFSKGIKIWLYFAFTIFILAYILSHAYIKKKYPDYYFNS